MNKQLIQLTDTQLDSIVGGVDFKGLIKKAPGAIFNVVDAPGQLVAKGVTIALGEGKQSPWDIDGQNAVKGFANLLNLATEVGIGTAIFFGVKFAYSKLKPMIFKKTA